MRQLVAEDGHRGAEAAREAGGEGSADGQAVTQVVDAVPEDHHPRHGRHRPRHRALPVGVALALALTFGVALTAVMALGVRSRPLVVMIVPAMLVVVQESFVVFVAIVVGENGCFSDRKVLSRVWFAC